MPSRLAERGEARRGARPCASMTRPPLKPPGPRMISITPMPVSCRLHFMRGKAMPWSVVQMTSVRSARPVRSSAVEHLAHLGVERAGDGVEGGHVVARLRRVRQRQGRRRVARVVVGPQAGSGNSRCVSTKPTERKNGSAGARVHEPARPPRKDRSSSPCRRRLLLVADGLWRRVAALASCCTPLSVVR